MKSGESLNPNCLYKPTGYVCPKCESKTYERYKPFCADCGARLPSQKRLELLGYTNNPSYYSQEIGDVSAIRNFLASVGNVDCWLERYVASWRTAEIRLRVEDSLNGSHALCCSNTELLCVPVGASGWRGTLDLVQHSNNDHELSDRTNGVEVRAGSVRLFAVDQTSRFSW